jgi:hypothetical protein
MQFTCLEIIVHHLNMFAFANPTYGVTGLCFVSTRTTAMHAIVRSSSIVHDLGILDHSIFNFDRFL